MAKKRKTPSSPRDPAEESGRRFHGHEAAVIAVGRVDRDTDEQDLGDLHPGFLDNLELGDGTQVDPHARRAEDDELLDLGGLGAMGGSSARLDSSAYASVDIDMGTGAGDVPRGELGEAVDERRLTGTLLKIFTRRRQQIRLSLDQLSRLSGISLHHLEAFENPRPGQSITYDQVVVLARVLGLPADQLPGLRRKESRPHLGVLLAELERTLIGAPLLRFEGAHGERYGGDVERAASSKAFTVRIEDASLQPVLERGTVLGFMNGVEPRLNGILLLRHRRSSLLAMRRYTPASYEGLVSWQPAYVVGGEWHMVGSLEVTLPPR